MALNAIGNVFLGAGGAAAGFLVKSVKVAGQLDEVKKSMAAVEGANKAAFDMDYVDKFAQHSKFTYLDLAEAAKRLALQNVSVKDTLGDVADVAAASGKPLAQVAQLYDALLGGGRVGLALSARGGFAQYGLSTREIFAAAGMPYTPGQNLQNAMSPQQVADAVHKLLATSGRAGLNEKLANTTLSGVQGMMEDALTRVENNLGTAKLPETIALASKAAGALNSLADAIKNTPGAGDKFVMGTVGALAVGGILKGIAAWRQYSAILKTATALGKIERAGEAAKVPVAAAEGAAVEGAASKYVLMKTVLGNVGKAALGESAAFVGARTAILAGGTALSMYALIAVGAAADIYAVVGAMKALGDASTHVEKAQAANADAKKAGYDLKQSHVTGFGAMPAWKQYLLLLDNRLTFGLVAKMHPQMYAETGFSGLTDAQTRAAAARHGAPPGGVRGQQLAAEKSAAEKAAQARKDAADAAAKAADSYELPADVSYRLKAEERRLILLQAQGASQNALNAAKKQEIVGLEYASRLLREQAKLAGDPKSRYKLLDEADENDQKAAMLKLDKYGKGKNGFDRTIATILGAGGLGEEEILKRTGVGRGMFASLGRGRPPASPLRGLIERAAKRPTVVQLSLNGRVLQEIKTEAVDETLKEILSMLESGSARPVLGGH